MILMMLLGNISWHEAIVSMCLLTHLFLAPFTKVEESFNVQASHDFIHLGLLGRNSFDHIEFPGVVPRSCIGAFILALPAKAMNFFLVNSNPSGGGENHLWMLFLVRGFLAISFLGPSLIFLGKAAKKSLGDKTQYYYILLLVSQFHLMFYGSRLLPNTLALVFTTFAQACLMIQKDDIAVALLVFCTVVFRCDTLVLMGPLALQLFYDRFFVKREFFIPLVSHFLFLGLGVGCISLVFTVLIDSWFWGRWLWPEGEVLYFNAVLNKSHEWGTSPFYWYFTSALPRALLISYPLGIIGMFQINFSARSLPEILKLDYRICHFMIPNLLYVILYSFLPHKEVRFIFPCLPMFTVSAAACLEKLDNTVQAFVQSSTQIEKENTLKRSAPFMKFSKPGLIISKLGIFVSLILSYIFLIVSSYNYPGGYAFAAMHEYDDVNFYGISSSFTRTVHIDVLSAMTGVSRFGERKNQVWKYSKEENLHDFSHFTYLLTENPDLYLNDFEVIHEEYGFSGISLSLKERGWIKFHIKPMVYVMKNKSITKVQY